MKRSELQNNLAMLVVLVGLTMLFATLFMGYAIYRTNAPTWPPMGIQKVSLSLPIWSTIVIFISSFFYYHVRDCIKINDLKRARKNLDLTILFGLGFMFTQSLLWSHLKATGLYVGSGIFASILYAFTWIHAAHVVAGIFALVYLRIFLKPTTEDLMQKAINVEKFWYFLEIVWLIMFVTLFVI